MYNGHLSTLMVGYLLGPDDIHPVRTNEECLREVYITQKYLEYLYSTGNYHFITPQPDE